MSDETKKYTKAQVTAMANRYFPVCRGRGWCEHFEYVQTGATGYPDNLFFPVFSGCYYAYRLPWGEKEWCAKTPPKEGVGVTRLKSLTWSDLRKPKKSR